MRRVNIEMPWTTLIGEVASQSNLTINLPLTRWRPAANILKARAWGEVRNFTLAGDTSMTGRMYLEFVNAETESPSVVLLGPTWTTNGWQGPGSGGYTDVSSTAAQYLLARAGWQLTLTLASGTARPFLLAMGNLEIQLQ